MTDKTGAVTVSSIRSLSVTGQIELLQKMLNDTASAPNYQLESKTVHTFEIIRGLDELHGESDGEKSGSASLFEAWIEWLADWDNYSRNLLHRRRLIGILNKGLGEGRYSLQIYPYASRLYTIGPVSGVMAVYLHEGLDYMTESESRRFASMIISKNKGIRAMVKDYMDGPPRSEK